jgi:DNA-binding PadR family transcriptional regulator
MARIPEDDANNREPLTTAAFNVLLALADGDKHGYAILKEVSEQTAGEVQLSTGTLYGIIKRLLSDGLITEVRERPPKPEDDSRRRYYKLTASGREVASAEAQRMERLLTAARSKRLIKAFRPS